MSRIKATILGTTAGVPTRQRGHSATYISYDDRNEFCFLFDCGEGTQRQLMRARLNIMKIDAVFITHWHGDHCLGLPGLVDTMGFEERQRPLAIYAPEPGRIRKCLGSGYSMGSFPLMRKGVPVKGSRNTVLREEEGFSIVSVPVKHGIPAVAYAVLEKDRTGIDRKKAAELGLPAEGRFYAELKDRGEAVIGGRKIMLEDVASSEKGKKIVYSGDTEICANLVELARGADLLIQDCTYFSAQGPDRPYKHASLPEVMKMAEEAGVKRTVLTHISRKYQNMEELRALVADREDLEVAEDLMAVEV